MTNVNFMKIKIAVKKDKLYKFYSASLSKAKLSKLIVKLNLRQAFNIIQKLSKMSNIQYSFNNFQQNNT